MKTLLDGVNRVLIKVSEVESRSQLTSLTDASRQVFVDTAIDAWNESVTEMYGYSVEPRPNALKSRTIALAAGQREYRLNSELVILRTDYHLVDETNNDWIPILDDGHRWLIHWDPEQNDTGLPNWSAINPENGKLMFDRTPTANEDGRTYKYRYEKDLELTDADDEFPFSDAVFRALVQCVAEKWKYEHRQSGSMEVYDRYMAEACRLLRRTPARRSWSRVISGDAMADPFVAA